MVSKWDGPELMQFPTNQKEMMSEIYLDVFFDSYTLFCRRKMLRNQMHHILVPGGNAEPQFQRFPLDPPVRAELPGSSGGTAIAGTFGTLRLWPCLSMLLSFPRPLRRNLCELWCCMVMYVAFWCVVDFNLCFAILCFRHRRKWWWWESNVSWKCHLFHSTGTARAGWHRCKMVKSYPSILQQNFRLAKDTVLHSAPSENVCCKVIVGELCQQLEQVTVSNEM